MNKQEFMAGDILHRKLLGTDCMLRCLRAGCAPDCYDDAAVWWASKQDATPRFAIEHAWAVPNLQFRIEGRMFCVGLPFFMTSFDKSSGMVGRRYSLKEFRDDFCRFVCDVSLRGYSLNRFYMPLLGVVSPEQVVSLERSLVRCGISEIHGDFNRSPTSLTKLFKSVALVACFGDVDLAIEAIKTGILNQEFEVQDTLLQEGYRGDIMSQFADCDEEYFAMQGNKKTEPV